MQVKTARAVILSMLFVTSSAMAQEGSEAPSVSSRAGGGRFRFGINGAGGLEHVQSVSGPMFGLDLRLGWQLNDLFAIYAQPHFSFGSLGTSVGGVGISGATGTFVGTVLGEVTLADRFFGGLGIGYGILNNPSGFAFEARVGAYPLMSRSADGTRRKGLMVGVDLKTVFISGATGLLVLGCVGYEAF